MPFQLDENNAKYQIRAYQPGYLKINDEVLNASVLISFDKLITNWPPQSVDELTAASLNQALALEPEVLLIGTGSKLIFLSPEIYSAFIGKQIGVEVMDTSAACRTFNALTAENRRVVAALIIR